MDTVELSSEEWEWFKYLARLAPSNRTPPKNIRSKLLDLGLVKEEHSGGLIPTVVGRDVLNLVEGRARRGWRRKKTNRDVS